MAARKNTAKANVEAEAVEEVAPEVVEDAAPEAAEVTEKPKRGGRKASPLTQPTRDYEKAKRRANRAREAYQRVQDVTAELEAAQAEEQEAYAALQAAIESLG